MEYKGFAKPNFFYGFISRGGKGNSVTMFQFHCCISVFDSILIKKSASKLSTPY